MNERKLASAGAVKVIYEVEQFPVFQNRMYDSQEEAKNCPKGDIRLVESLKSGLVYNERFRPEIMQYDDNYQNEQGVSSVFRTHLETVLEIIANSIGRRSIVEVGCGKGLFLEMLLANRFDARGFDPTYEGTNPRVTKQYFSAELGIQADGLVLRHVLEHVQDPVDFLMQLKDANNGGGKIYIEVPCFDWICEKRAWFDIFYEHVNYFRLIDLCRMFGSVYESGYLFGDQYLYVVADLSSVKYPEFDESTRAAIPNDFMSSLTDSYGLELSDEVIVWGGASKGVIFSLLKQRSGLDISTVIDINPAKQEKYLPASGLQVQAPDQVLPGLDSGSIILVMNSNYLQEIKSMTANKFTYVSIDHG